MANKCINTLNNSIVDGAIIIASKLDKNICSKSILMPNIIMEYNIINDQNTVDEKIVEHHFNRLIKKLVTI